MSSKSAPRPWSLSLRLTLWFGITYTILTGTVIGVIYWTLVNYVNEEIDRSLQAELQELHTHWDAAIDHFEDIEEQSTVRVTSPEGKVMIECQSNIRR
jgi:hypothetical protein